MEDQPAGIDRIVAMRGTIVQQTMRQRVPQMRPTFLQEYILDVRGNGQPEHRVEFGSHLLEQC